MFKFKIVIDVIEGEKGIHQETTISCVDGGVYNNTIALGALEIAKLNIRKEVKKE